MVLKKSVSLTLMSVGIFFGNVHPASAQYDTPQSNEKREVTKTESLLDANSIRKYKDLVPHELATFVKRSELVFDVGDTLPNVEAYRAKQTKPEGTYSVTGEGVITSPQGVSFRSIPFEVQEGAATSVKEQGYKILWNASAALWRHPYLRYDTSTYLFGSDIRAPQKMQCRLERIHPALYEKVPGGLSPIFREKVGLVKPEALKTLGWLTLRFFGAEEDYVWVGSPAIRKIMQVTGSNRSDPLFDEMLALDNLLVWSGKVERVRPLAVQSVSMLVPFYEVTLQRESNNDGCAGYGFGSSGGVVLNARSNRYSGRSGWIPSNIKLYKRDLWKIDLSSLDPYGLDPQQILYVDKQSMLPVYWSSYSIKGAFRRFSVGIIGAMRMDKEVEPMLVGQILFSEEAWRVVSVAENITVCQRKELKEVIKEFDPSTFISFKSQSS